ncbi:hypothetical protein IHQ71_19655 [Rhizobium sp. TH2]|uniref:AbrB/MazE/SpoVT family DNA-binding domain-containing protein n=1 Tax=Rhizobium sp. TH2 TaxID=2775403 RepID=UPI0021582997|nr:type II toxin-antitoxin system PrlF family antitoxin [Rhizobium sp. TH2]UVC07411.1 hypothetical protein IHQ71_19655 [Rhizobium sp. TH2]
MLRLDAKTSLKGRFTVPAEVRRAIGLAPGGLLQFIVDDNGTVSITAASEKPDDFLSNDCKTNQTNNPGA